tara:strand:- start:708 stop:1160 length:453 start_codon:yes stop_codon:yes gene_type:complete
MSKKIENDENVIEDFVKKEKKQLIDFLSGFEIVGLTIASIIGLAVSAVSKTFTEEIILPLFGPIFSHDLKTFTINLGYSKLGIGLFLSDIIYLSITILTMFIIYSLFKAYLSSIIDKKNDSNTKLYKYQSKMIKELSEIKKELKKNNNNE